MNLEALILLSNEDYEKQEVSRYPQLVFDHIHANDKHLAGLEVNFFHSSCPAFELAPHHSDSVLGPESHCSPLIFFPELFGKRGVHKLFP